MMWIPTLVTAMLMLCAVSPAKAQRCPEEPKNCREIVPVGSPPYTAEDFPLPISLRVNLIFLMKEEMNARGMYDARLDSGVFTDLLEARIRELQNKRGEAQTGCITWELVRELDSKKREPPAESESTQ